MTTVVWATDVHFDAAEKSAIRSFFVRVRARIGALRHPGLHWLPGFACGAMGELLLSAANSLTG